MTASALSQPFDDIRRLIAAMPGPDADAVAAVRQRDRGLTKPAGSLGRLEELVEWLAAWQGKPQPSVDRPLVCVFAASHGVAARGVSAYPAAVNRQMLDNFAAGGAAINQVCATLGLGFKVFDLALDLPTNDIVVDAAMDEKTCVATMAFGMEALAGGADLLGVGEMGIGNTTIAAAIYAALYGGPVESGSGAARAWTTTACAGKRRPWRRRSTATVNISAIRWRCCGGSGAATSRRWPARFWERGSSACRWCSTATWRPPPPRSSTRSTRAPSPTASPGIFRRRARTKRFCVG